MNWRAKIHPLEIIATIVATLLFTAACTWSAWVVQGSVVAAASACVGAAAIGMLVIRQGTQIPASMAKFETESLGLVNDEQPAVEVSVDELLLDDILLPDTLWLDDPLVAPEEDSRVVRLFAAAPATPGELVERISDYLGGAPTLAGPPVQPAHDASADLYVALANIRASLR